MKMLRFAIVIISVLSGSLVLNLFPADCAEDSTAGEDYRIINVADDFIAYYETCKDENRKTKIAKWDEMLEQKHADFFDQVLYRDKKDEDRKEFKRSLIKDFWTKYASRMDKISALNDNAETEIRNVIREFSKTFPDFDASRDYYVTIAFSFRGKVTDINGTGVFAIGLEEFGDDILQFKITVAHELFHLYHFQFFSTKGAIYRKLWAEGMATYASALIVPGYRDSKYLNFPAEKMNKCFELLPEMASELRKNMGEANYRLERIYLGGEKNDTNIPPEAGYYVGLQVVGELAKKIPFGELAKMEAKDVYGLIEEQLRILEETGKKE